MPFAYFATRTATTKRTPAISGGKRGAPAAYLTGVNCTPSYPVDPETLRRMNINTPAQMRRCLVFETYDIVEGDTITISGEVEREISKIEMWPHPDGTQHRNLFLQDLKG